MADRKTLFKPFKKRDISLIHKDGFYFDNKKVSGPEKVVQMCALILINRLNLDIEVKTLSNPNFLDTIAFLKGSEVKFIFENDPDTEPDEKLKEISLVSAEYDLINKAAVIKYDILTESGETAPLHLRIPLGEDNYIE